MSSINIFHMVCYSVNEIKNCSRYVGKQAQHSKSFKSEFVFIHLLAFDCTLTYGESEKKCSQVILPTRLADKEWVPCLPYVCVCVSCEVVKIFLFKH